MFDTIETYSSDLELFKKLGLQPFKLKSHQEHLVGRVEYEDGIFVTVYVTGMPAQFFRAVIFCGDSGKTVEVETGSGTLSDYWNSFNMIAKDMLVLREVK